MTIQISFAKQSSYLRDSSFYKIDKLKNESKLEKQETTKMAGGKVKKRTTVVERIEK